MQTAEDTDAVVNACKEAGVQYMDGTMWLHNPRTHYMKEILSNQHLMGPLQTVISAFNWLGGWQRLMCVSLCACISMHMLVHVRGELWMKKMKKKMMKLWVCLFLSWIMQNKLVSCCRLLLHL